MLQKKILILKNKGKMARMNRPFDAEEQEGMADIGKPIPNGKYLAHVVESDWKTTKRKDGHYIELTFKILSGEYKNRQVWELYNIDNPSMIAEGISKKALKTLVDALNVAEEFKESSDTQTLHGVPVIIKVATRPSNDDYPPKNVIKYYWGVEDPDAEFEDVEEITAPSLNDKFADIPRKSKKDSGIRSQDRTAKKFDNWKEDINEDDIPG